MKKITSFTVDHRTMIPGIYVSRIDGDITTYDMRLKKPNGGDYMTDLEAHSFEHMFATFIRNSKIAEDVIYFGPMGCMTGFYLLVRNAENAKILHEVLWALDGIISHDGGVFGASEIECGNYKCLDILSAKSVAEDYKRVLTARDIDFDYHCEITE